MLAYNEARLSGLAISSASSKEKLYSRNLRGFIEIRETGYGESMFICRSNMIKYGYVSKTLTMCMY